MTMKFRIGVVLLCAALVGWGTPERKRLTTPLTEANKSSYVVIWLSQSEIAVDDVTSPRGNLMMGALEFAAKGATTDNRRDAVADMRNALLEEGFEPMAVSAFESQLPLSLVKADARVRVVRNDDEWQALLKTIVPANVLSVKLRYAFETNLDIVYAKADVTLQTFERMPPDEATFHKMSFAKRRASTPLELHAGQYYSEHVMHVPFNDLRSAGARIDYDGNAQRWAIRDAEPLKRALSRAAAEIASLVRRDGEGALPSERLSRVRAHVVDEFLAATVAGAIQVERNGGRSLILIDGAPRWVDNRQLRR